MAWTTEADKFQERNQIALESLFRLHPCVRVKVYSNTLPSTFFHAFHHSGFRIEVIRYDLGSIVEPEEAGYQWAQQWHHWAHFPYFYSHLTDFFRFLLLFKQGGSYMDFDHLVTRPMMHFENATGTEYCESYNPDCFTIADHPSLRIEGSGWDIAQRLLPAPGVMIGFEAGNALLKAALTHFDNDYDPSCWGCVGPRLLGRLIPLFPDALILLPKHYFYLVDYTIVAKYSQNSDERLVHRFMHEAYGLHLYGKVSSRLTIKPSSVVGRVISNVRIFKEMLCGMSISLSQGQPNDSDHSWHDNT